MNSQQLLDEILGILRTVKDDKAKLQKIREFMQNEILIEIEDDKIEIPAKFLSVIKTIVGNIYAGLICYLNTDTLEIEDIPQKFANDYDEMEKETGISVNELELKHFDWENCIEFLPLESRESFRIMEDFTMQLKDTTFKNKLINVLNNRKPFANFNRIIHNSDFRQEWFDFKTNQLHKHVRFIISDFID
ncbi:MAG: UPF0158 family protein [Paludibacter sp.]|nr:UPF0158 family protein [Paludibacter sp.]